MGLTAPGRPVMPSARPRLPGLASTAAALALTFDDGPDPRGTPGVLDALERAGARATFFVIAPAAERHPELVRRALASGHRVELHCDRHIRHTELDERAIREDAERGLLRLTRLGVEPTLWRVPWGVEAEATPAVAAELGLTLVGWDVDTHDWRGDDAAQMLTATRAALAPGAVVLAHDGVGPGARRPDCARTADYVDLVAGHAARAGLALASL
ncbi:MAG TPA: polysaccharide deacetylase family protein [Solirubrobacteraceae bacterium]|nr:polysaccharide deacetylase family protein [Solirubrobacteraceae bacterium]